MSLSISNIEELKEFILWCKENKVKKVKLDSLEFDIYELGLLDVTQTSTDTKVSSSANLSDTLKEPSVNEDPDLYWSTNT